MPRPGPRRYKALPALCGHYVSPFHKPEKPGFGNRKRLSGDPGAGDRATIDIDPTLIPLKHLANRKRLCSKRFVASIRRSTSANCQPTRSRQRRVAYTGAIPINAGSTPTLANARMRASTGKFNARALASLIIITAAAPSFMDDAFPGEQNRDYQMKDLNGLNLLHWRQCVAVHRYQQPTSDRYFG